MAKTKTLEQLRAEKERAETQLAQEQHKLQRFENRKQYYEKGERQKRTHRLCNLGGTIESLAPKVKDLTRTEKGEFNRMIKATNALIREVRKKITFLIGWIADMKAELVGTQTPDLVSLLNVYYSQRNAGARYQSGKVHNLKEMNETFNYLQESGIYTLEDLESRVGSHRTTVDGLKEMLDSQTARMKEIRRLFDYADTYKRLMPVFDGCRKESEKDITPIYLSLPNMERNTFMQTVEKQYICFRFD